MNALEHGCVIQLTSQRCRQVNKKSNASPFSPYFTKYTFMYTNSSDHFVNTLLGLKVCLKKQALKENKCWFLTFRSVQSLSHVRFFGTPWTAACQSSASITNSRSLLKLTSIESVMPSNHFILSCPLFLLPSLFPSIRVFSNEFFASGGQSIGPSASASVLPVNLQGWFPLGWTGWTSLQWNATAVRSLSAPARVAPTCHN